jgi:hypothetical protein
MFSLFFLFAALFFYFLFPCRQGATSVVVGLLGLLDAVVLRGSGEELGDAEAIEAVVDVAPSGDLPFQVDDSLLQLAVLLLEHSLLALGRLNK